MRSALTEIPIFCLSTPLRIVASIVDTGKTLFHFLVAIVHTGRYMQLIADDYLMTI